MSSLLVKSFSLKNREVSAQFVQFDIKVFSFKKYYKVEFSKETFAFSVNSASSFAFCALKMAQVYSALSKREKKRKKNVGSCET